MSTHTLTHTSRNRRFVLDTTALISYFSPVFKRGSKITERAITLIDTAFQYEYPILLSIPGVVFVEIFDKWFRGTDAPSQEFRAEFRAEVLQRVRSAPNIEIREVDAEILEMFLTLEDPDINLENRDRIVLASAAVLDSPLITSDEKVIQYVRRHQVIPAIIS